MGRSSSPRVGWAGPLPAHFPPGKERNSFPRFPQRSWMKKSPLLILSVLLAACGPDKLISDLPSPNEQYHVEVRKCPEKGSITWGEEIQVSLLETGKSEKCHAVVRSLAQFDLRASADQLQLEWLSDTELRAWHPSFEPGNQPNGSRLKRDAPVKMVFAPKR
ncbi:TPA: hypothetical protein ACJIVN_001205 [Pseudomonas aeruginosa]